MGLPEQAEADIQFDEKVLSKIKSEALFRCLSSSNIVTPTIAETPTKSRWSESC